MTRIRPSVAYSLVLALAVAACAKVDEHPIDSTSVVAEHGIGQLRAGMTVAEARAVIPSFAVPASRDSTACTYGKANGLPAGVAVMVEGMKVARVEVRSGDVATTFGARIGDSEEKIKTLYPKVSVSPHKYTAGGHYLTVVPASKADSAYRIIFETDGKRVVVPCRAPTTGRVRRRMRLTLRADIR